jgi:hypothetical protein
MGAANSTTAATAAPAAAPVAAAPVADAKPVFPYKVLGMEVDEDLHNSYQETPELLK